MQLSDFDYHLPKELIAHYPLKERSSSRLLCLNRDSGDIQHKQFRDLLDFLNPNDLLIFNNTKVIPARLLGVKETGGKIEVLIERVLDEKHALVHLRASKTPRLGMHVLLENFIDACIQEKKGDLFVIEFLHKASVFELLENYGRVPLPPYINRNPEQFDIERYQTVYAKEKGAIAAPTAGLHFDDPLLQKIHKKGVKTAFITLHVGAGTFQPVRVERINKHKMHEEYIDVNENICKLISETKLNNKRVIAAGTTTVRALETAAQTGGVEPYCGDTNIFIYPGFRFHCVDAMITNFHLPKSSLLMLVSAFGRHESIMNAYQVATKEKYRFYSYGDAMLIY